ncbi:hypothetical protein PBT90_14730 [Algoriphagus halophytocola]|uniref:DUF4181 domain-containing protein n=1 Tax=Algoriphagus halophytocola TaxID=2991499 RepID=A0ABY6MM69_9BACT|nr:MULTISPECIES: hypothetical protein [unclassified Algoriphagus]UZD24634.1 hypothetical protein OM944_09065 [Algoriphagus sp. TR-M5]WBL42002.1 hypothetical protein PBT90_14730 [Algoriphagus sp. TR-M9]
MEKENWAIRLFFGVLILALGIWLEKRRDKKTKKWYHGGYIDLQYKWGIWTIIGCGQILIWQGAMILFGINWVPIVGVYILFGGGYYLFRSLNSYHEVSWYNRIIRNKGSAIGLMLFGILLVVLGSYLRKFTSN